jgi:predicted house-cleaning noncanonical NTP pyrophosphatase (MazG superfamily)
MSNEAVEEVIAKEIISNTVKECNIKCSKKYECEQQLQKCIVEFVEELDRALLDATDHYCFVENYNTEAVAIACGLLDSIYTRLEFDYDITVKVRARIVKTTRI